MTGLNGIPRRAAMTIRNFNGTNDVITQLLFSTNCGIITIDSSQNNILTPRKLSVPDVRRFGATADDLRTVCYRKSIYGVVRSRAALAGRRLLALSISVLVPTTLRGRVATSGTSRIRTHCVFRITGNPVATSTSLVLRSGNVSIFPSVLIGTKKIAIDCFR